MGVLLSLMAKKESGFKISGTTEIILLGDSLMAAYFAANPQISIESHAQTYFEDAVFIDFAQGGYALVSADGTGAFRRSDTNAASTFYNNSVSNNAGISPKICFISLGTNDTETAYTQPQWTGYYEDLIDELISDYPSLQHIVIQILGRHTGNNTYDFNRRRASQWEVISNNSSGKVSCSIEVWDVEIGAAGGVHPNDAGYDTMAERICGVAHGLLKTGSSFGVFGPNITAAALSDNQIQLTINADGANDLTLPATAKDVFKVFITENGVEQTLTPTGISKISAERIDLTLASRLQGTDPKLYYGFQTLYGLDNADPGAIRSSTLPLELPLHLSKPAITIGASSDLVKNISGLQYDCDPQRNNIILKTGTITDEIESIASINGRRFENQNSGHHAVLVSNASGGKAGMKSVTVGAQYKPTAVAQGQNQRGLILVGIAPNGASGSLMAQFGTTAADAQAGFQMSSASGGSLFWSRNAANGFTTVKTSFNLMKFMVAFIADADGTADIFFDNPIAPVVSNFTPKSNYGTDTSLHLFGSSVSNCLNNFTILRCFSFLGTLGGANPTLEDLFTQFNDEFSLGKTW